MKTELTAALTLQWESQQALAGATIVKLPRQFICGLFTASLEAPVMLLRRVGNIRGVVKAEFYWGHCSHAIQR